MLFEKYALTEKIDLAIVDNLIHYSYYSSIFSYLLIHELKVTSTKNITCNKFHQNILVLKSKWGTLNGNF